MSEDTGEAPLPPARPAWADWLDVARVARARGDAVAALTALGEGLALPGLQPAATVPAARVVAVLWLEAAGIDLDRGELVGADGAVRNALAHFERAQDRGGAAAAALLAGDLAAAAGRTAAAAAWWQRALALADAAGAGPLAARALMSLALAGGIDADEAAQGLDFDAIAGAAARRLQAALPAAIDPADPASPAAQAQQQASEIAWSLARLRHDIRDGRLAEARLGLPMVIDQAAALAEPALAIEALRLDASLARRSGDPRAATDSLARASAMAHRHGLALVAAALDAERVLALVDDERWDEAFDLAAQEPPAALAAVPAIHALRLEAYAALAARTGQAQGARAAVDQALALREDASDASALARTRALAADLALRGGDTDRAAALAGAVAHDAAAPADARLTALVTADAAGAARGDGPAPRALALSAAAPWAGRAGAVAQVAWWLARADVAARQSDAATGEEALGRAEALAERVPLLRTRARVAAAALALRAQSDPAAALAAAGEVVAQARAAGDDRALAEATLAAGLALLARGRVDDALLAFAQAEQLGRTLAWPAAVARALAGQADASARAGQGVQAQALWHRAAEAAARSGETALQVRAWRALAQIAADSGDSAAALGWLDRAAAAARGPARGVIALERLRAAGGADSHSGDAGSLAAAVAAIVAGLGEDAGDDGVTVEAALLVAAAEARAGLHSAARARLVPVEAAARRLGGRALAAWLVLAGQLDILAGDGAGGGSRLVEALQVAALAGAREREQLAALAFFRR